MHACTEFPSCRLVLTLMGVLASVNCYTTRVNLSVALVVMVNNTWLEHQIEGSDHDVHHISPCIPENASVTDVEVRVSVSDLLLEITFLDQKLISYRHSSCSSYCCCSCCWGDLFDPEVGVRDPLSCSNRGPVAVCTLGLGLLPSILKWSVNRVPACLAGVKTWRLHLCRVEGYTVWSHMASDIP